MPVKIFCCYAHENQKLLNRLKKYLTPFFRNGLITLWTDRDIIAGADWEYEIDTHLISAHMFSLLVSPSFMASNYCYSVEMQKALERHYLGEARVIPIILYPIHWQETPIGRLQALPTNGKPISTWRNTDEAFYKVAEGIRKVIVEEYENRIQAAISAREFHIKFEYAIEGSNDFNAETVPRGKRLILSFHINNNLPFAFSIWLGASLRIDEQYFFNIEEDTEVLLQPGSGTYMRFLTIRNNWPTGNYYLEAAAHYGIRSDPGKSILLDNVWTHTSLLKIM